MSFQPLIRRVPPLLALSAITLVFTAPPASAMPMSVEAGAAPPAVAVAADLTATIRLSNCSASLVRYPTSRDTDRAMMLTNGHCFIEGEEPAPGEVIVNRPSSRRGTLLNSRGSSVLSLTADRVLYATETDTDVTLYRLTRSFNSIRSASGISARTISASHPVPGDTFVPSGFFGRVFNCDIEKFVPTLREDVWTWHDSIRYASGCNTIHGTSGSPIISVATGQVVGINNTGNDDGQRCTLNNPCEVNPDGTIFFRKGLNYGQQTFWFTTCLTPGRTIDLNKPGCQLAKPRS